MMYLPQVYEPINSPRAPAGNIVPDQTSTNINGAVRGGDPATQDLVAWAAKHSVQYENQVVKDNGPGGDADTHRYVQHLDKKNSPPGRKQKEDASKPSGNHQSLDSSSAHSQATQSTFQGENLSRNPSARGSCLAPTPCHGCLAWMATPAIV